MPLFRWEDIDHSLVRLRLIDLAEKMHSQIKADERHIQFENRGNLNSNTVPSLVLKMKQDRADEWTRRVYEIYCAVWQTLRIRKVSRFFASRPRAGNRTCTPSPDRSDCIRVCAVCDSHEFSCWAPQCPPAESSTQHAEA